MKTRHGFVSNSSSSSFILISDRLTMDHQHGTNLLQGEYEFGWEQNLYDGVASKVNFSLLIGSVEQIEQTKRVFKEYTGHDLDEEEVEDVLRMGYIDHQSVCEENREMFESDEKLRYFLFNPYSLIETDNDNH
jgi:hypothetical protein